MKKKIVLALLVVVLLLAGVGGGVYAAGAHEPVKGNKLIGLGGLGTMTFPGDLGSQRTNSGFVITNSDCVNEITITQLSILREDGSVVYQGPLILVIPGTPGIEVREIVTRPMEPHEVWRLMLHFYMWTGGGDPDDLTDPDNWLIPPEASAQPSQTYTVEIAWRASGKANVCPLIGWWEQGTTRFDLLGNQVDNWVTSNQMVNMTQGK